MFARIVQITAKSGQGPNLSEHTRDRTINALKQQAGFIDMVVLKSDTDPNQFVGISLWKSKEEAEKFLASQQWQQLVQEFRPLVQGDPIIRTFNVDASTMQNVSTRAEADAVTAVSNLENDAVKANLGGDSGFYQKTLVEDWTRGDSDGTYYTKADLLGLMADTNNIKTNSEKLSELTVRAYGNTAVATYKDTYDIVIKGEHRAHTIIATDTFVNIGGEWKQVASHGSEAK